ncbi:phospholipid phosphatase 1-like [Hydractinia symbiolongicarpus]|uniref:phospholipid phosphatase 1-like n=1 Tax=Hydractinia symbiolongicarpus TaxID=13093 RepID=UPI00254FBC40|nr:phospholipid phosphatase 1-like [Hydractinia symbiolongicarpus]
MVNTVITTFIPQRCRGSSPLLYVQILLVIISDVINFISRPFDSKEKEVLVTICALKLKRWLIRLLFKVVSTLYGAVMVDVILNLSKPLMGGLRPHFVTSCRPDYSNINCSKRYITENVCTNNEDVVDAARVSFPSGHSTVALFTTVFIGLYLHYVFSKKYLFVKAFLQTVLFSLAVFICSSRISDYAHHWYDVLAGAILGSTGSLYTVYVLLQLPLESKNFPGSREIDEKEYENSLNEHLKFLRRQQIRSLQNN